MKRNTVKAGNHFIEVNQTSNGWEISVIPPLDVDPKGKPIDEQIVPTHNRMEQWVLTHSGQYVWEALKG